MKKSDSYLVNTALACGILYYVVDLSAIGRTFVDWTVIVVVGGAIAWNIVRLALRLLEARSGRDVWHLIRTLSFWLVGLANTAWVSAESSGTWVSWAGWLFLFAAVVDSVLLYQLEQRARQVIDDRAVAVR